MQKLSCVRDFVNKKLLHKSCVVAWEGAYDALELIFVLCINFQQFSIYAHEDYMDRTKFSVKIVVCCIDGAFNHVC